jgi:hypothetical protein
VRRAYQVAAELMQGHLGGESVTYVPMGDIMSTRSLLVNAVSTSQFSGLMAHIPWPYVPPKKKTQHRYDVEPLADDQGIVREMNLVPPLALLQFLAPIWSLKKNGRKPRLKYHVPFGASHGISPLGCKIDEATSTDDDRSLLIINMTLALVADACHVPVSQLVLRRRVRHNLVFTDYLPFAIDMPRFIERHQDIIVPPKRERLAGLGRRRGRGRARATSGTMAPPERKFRGAVVKVPHADNDKLRLLVVSPKAMICAGCKVPQQNTDALFFIWHVLQGDGPNAIRPLSTLSTPAHGAPPLKRLRRDTGADD